MTFRPEKRQNVTLTVVKHKFPLLTTKFDEDPRVQGPIHTRRVSRFVCLNLPANPLMFLATCVNTPISYSVFHYLRAHVARCFASCVNGPRPISGKAQQYNSGMLINFFVEQSIRSERKKIFCRKSSLASTSDSTLLVSSLSDLEPQPIRETR